VESPWWASLGHIAPANASQFERVARSAVADKLIVHDHSLTS